MNKPVLTAVLLSLLLFYAGCTTENHNIYKNSKVQTYLPYSDLARISHLSLDNDGYIIGIEKRKREFLGGVPERHYPDRFSPIPVPEEEGAAKKRIQIKNKYFSKCTRYDSVMLVTHIARYFEKQDCNDRYNTFKKPYFLYNAYDVYKDDSLNYENGYEGLDNLKEKLVADLKLKIQEKRPYSHIIVFSMGWNNNQQESIYRYNTILNNVKMVADKENDGYFKPLVIGFTWPSVWFGIENNWLKKNTSFLFSYFTKQDDADEIGCTVANWVVHNVVLAAKEEIEKDCKDNNMPVSSPRVVAIGHSMGARILSRAILSKEYIKPRTNKALPNAHVDLLVGLQGAFSAQRFVKGKGWEGSPYAEFNRCATVFSLTTSRYDTANQTAHFITGAWHVGSKYGLAFASKNKNEFRVIKWNNNNEADSQALLSILNSEKEKDRRVIMIDASKIVNGRNSTTKENYPSDAHNDILDEDLARLIWALINRFAPFPCTTQ